MKLRQQLYLFSFLLLGLLVSAQQITWTIASFYSTTALSDFPVIP